MVVWLLVFVSASAGWLVGWLLSFYTKEFWLHLLTMVLVGWLGGHDVCALLLLPVLGELAASDS